MALTASAFAYTWSKWNADCGKDKIIIQAVEQLEDEQPLEVVLIFFQTSTHLHIFLSKIINSPEACFSNFQVT